MSPLSQDFVNAEGTTLRRVLILGAMSPDGREAITHLYTHSPSTYIRGVGKAHNENVDLSSRQRAAIHACDFHQTNLHDATARAAAFALPPGEVWDAVWNYGAEERLGLGKDVYHRWVERVSILCAEEAIRCKARVYIHVSTALVYADDGKESKEDSPLHGSIPWAEAHIRAEKGLQAMANLPLVILRPGIIYGPDDTKFVSHLLICGRIYQALGEVMRGIHRGDRRVNTLHAFDLAAATMHLSCWYIETGQTTSKIFNIADHGHTTLSTLNNMVASIFGITVKYHWWVVSKAISMAPKYIESALDEANEKHLGPWTRLLERSNIDHSPLTPFLDPEYFHGYEVMADGNKVVRETGFTYRHPHVTQAALEDVITEWKDAGIWPSDEACL